MKPAVSFVGALSTSNLSRKQVFFLMSGGLLMSGVTLGQGALFLIGFFLLAGPLSMFYVLFHQIGKIEVERVSIASGFEDQVVTVRLTVTNRSAFPVYQMAVVDHFGPDETPTKVTLLPRALPPYSSIEIEYQGACFRRRGVYELGPTELRLTEPFECFSLSRRLHNTTRFHVYPDIFHIVALRLNGDSRLKHFQPQHSLRSGASLESIGVREYRTGDPVRLIHWPQTAKRDAIMIRDTALEVGSQTWIFLDLYRGRRAGLGHHSVEEYAVKCAGAVAEYAIRAGHPVGLLAVGEEETLLPPLAGDVQLHEILRSLIFVKQTGEHRIEEVIAARAPGLPSRATVFLILATADLTLGNVDSIMRELLARAAFVTVVLIDDTGFYAIEKNRYRRRGDASVDLARALATAGAITYIVERERGLTDSFVAPAFTEATPAAAR